MAQTDPVNKPSCLQRENLIKDTMKQHRRESVPLEWVPNMFGKLIWYWALEDAGLNLDLWENSWYRVSALWIRTANEVLIHSCSHKARIALFWQESIFIRVKSTVAKRAANSICGSVAVLICYKRKLVAIQFITRLCIRYNLLSTKLIKKLN
jgi:hypothetical protein